MAAAPANDSKKASIGIELAPKNGRKPSILILLEIKCPRKMAAKPYFMRVFAFFLCPKFWGFCSCVRPFVCQLYALLLHRADVAAF